MTLVPEQAIAPQKALDMISLKPDEILESVKEELQGKTPVQVKELKITIVNICRSQALAHRHAADAADHLVTLTDIASMLVVLTVMNAVQWPVVAVKIPEVDEMMQRAQDKVDAIRRVKTRAAGVRPIDEVIFAQNVPTYNPEWHHSNKRKATSYLAMLVCRYMNKLQRKDKKVVLSAKALEAIYHTASSSVGKLISGKQYPGGYAMQQQHGKVEAAGKELPDKWCKKLQTKETAMPSTSGVMEHWRSLQNIREICRKECGKCSLDHGKLQTISKKMTTNQRIFRTFVEFANNKPKSCCSEFINWRKHAEQWILRRFARLAKGKWRLLVADGLGAVLITSATSHP